MTDLVEFERQVMRSLGQKVHERIHKAAKAQLSPEAFGDPEAVADAMVAALPMGHVFDEISGPFYNTAGLVRWLGVSRQALHQKASRHAILACPLVDGGVVYPAWQFLDTGATIPSLGAVLVVLAQGTDDAWMTALWMQAVSDQLDSRRPSEWLREGRDPDRVVALARQAAAGWRA